MSTTEKETSVASTPEKESQQSTPTLNSVEKQQSETDVSKPAADEVTFPDGGLQAWLVVLGGVICNVVSFGYVTSYGVFQAYYTQYALPHENPSNIAWIGSIQAMMLLFPALFGGALFDAGWFRIPLLVSSLGFCLATFLVGQCTKYWHFVLCQGIASGFANGMLFGPVMTVIGHWWSKRRGLAFGLVMLGSSIGGVAIPIMVRRLIPKIGFPWTMRVLGFMFLGLLVIPNVTMKTRLPTKPRKGLKAIWDHTIFTKNLVYSLYVFGGFFGFMGVYTVMIFLDISAVTHGVDENFSFYLVAILNGVSAVGRLGSGKLSDPLGSGNVVIPSLFASAAVSFGFPFATTKSHFIAIGVMYGISSGAFITTYMPPIYDFGEMKDLGKRVGMAMTCLSLASLSGTPIAGALISRYGYEAAGYFSGACLTLAGLILILARHLYLKGELRGRF
ncbi:major facilitator superfamily domain-containing protein [Flagelloscypha sp. PMI_526]|nr:major facilitator superfamily domain-containing protein [Flagelloscypha sp. PMI_526]